MQASQRRIDSPVTARLRSESYRFGFFQTVRLFDRIFSRLSQAAGPDEARRLQLQRNLFERLSFRNSASLGFPASEIESLVLRDADGREVSEDDWVARMLDGDGRAAGSVDVTPAFFGLLGAQGALPSVYTEMVLRREQSSKDRAARAFLDLFTNRAAILFYQAWRKYRLALQDEDVGRRRYLQTLLWLTGAGRPINEISQPYAPDMVFDETMAGYVAAARHRPMSAAYLQRILAEHFRCDVRVEQFVGRWFDVPPTQRSMLGGNNVTLGQTAMVGGRIWQRDLRVRIWIGPLDRQAFDTFFPGQPHARALSRMLAFVAGVTVEYEVRLILAREHVKPVRLGFEGEGRLGWNGFLASRPADSDRSDTVYELQILN